MIFMLTATPSYVGHLPLHSFGPIARHGLSIRAGHAAEADAGNIRDDDAHTYDFSTSALRHADGAFSFAAASRCTFGCLHTGLLRAVRWRRPRPRRAAATFVTRHQRLRAFRDMPHFDSQALSFSFARRAPLMIDYFTTSHTTIYYESFYHY